MTDRALFAAVAPRLERAHRANLLADAEATLARVRRRAAALGT